MDGICESGKCGVPVARGLFPYLEDDVRDEENCQRRVIFRSINDVEILLEVEEGGIADVDPARRDGRSAKAGDSSRYV